MQRDTYRITDLHPIMSAPVQAVVTALRTRVFETGGLKFKLEVFEGYRSPIRQNYLFSQVPPVTKARAWEGAHQYGLSVDFAGIQIHTTGAIIPNKWVWPEATHPCWGELKSLARRFGLDVPIDWDKGHLEHPVFPQLRKLLR